MLQEEAQHLLRGIGPARIGVGARGAAAKPGMAGAVDHPLLDHRLPIRVNMQRTAVGVTTGNLAFLGVYPERRTPRRLSNDRVAITWVDRGVPVAMEDNGRNDPPLRPGWRGASRRCAEPPLPRCIAASAEGMSRAAPQARPECTPIAA